MRRETFGMAFLTVQTRCWLAPFFFLLPEKRAPELADSIKLVHLTFTLMEDEQVFFSHC